MNTHAQQAEGGFTLIELLMAMAVFSFMLMIVTGGFIQVVRVHQAGVASRTTQQNARLVLDGLMKDVRAAATATVADHGAKDLLCLAKGSQTLEYAVDSSGNLRVGTLSGATCPDPAVITGSWLTVNDPTVLVSQFDATTTPPLTPGLGTAMVTLTLVSRNNLTALDATQTHCLPGSGSQFCAVTTLSSGAALRGGNGL